MHEDNTGSNILKKYAVVEDLKHYNMYVEMKNILRGFLKVHFRIIKNIE